MRSASHLSGNVSATSTSISVKSNLVVLKGEDKLLNKWNTNTNPRHGGLASTWRMRTAISPGQWQPWTSVSPLLGFISIEVFLRVFRFSTE